MDISALKKSSILMGMCHSSLQTEGGMTFLHEKHGFKWGWKNPGEWKNPAGWTLTWIFASFFSLKVKNLLTISLKIFEFWIKIKDSNQSEWKNPQEERKNIGEWKNPAR